MKLGTLAGRIGTVGPANGDHLVVVQDKDTGKIFMIKDVQFETHEDADGSTTVWLVVEEY